jgi:hypothetical protein
VKSGVELIVEFHGGRVFDVEVKATSVPRRRDAQHLFWFADELGHRFAGGIVFAPARMPSTSGAGGRLANLRPIGRRHLTRAI